MVWLLTPKERRLASIRVAKLDRVDADTDTSCHLGKDFRRKGLLNEQLVLGRARNVRKLKVGASCAALQWLLLNMNAFLSQGLLDSELLEQLKLAVDCDHLLVALGHRPDNLHQPLALLLHVECNRFSDVLDHSSRLELVFRELQIQLVDRVQGRLVQLLEASVDLGSVLGSHVSCSHDKFVQVADAVVLLGRSVDPVTLLALLLSLGAVVLDVPLQVLPWKLLLSADLASNRL